LRGDNVQGFTRKLFCLNEKNENVSGSREYCSGLTIQMFQVQDKMLQLSANNIVALQKKILSFK
jgi:hypothetical protein